MPLRDCPIIQFNDKDLYVKLPIRIINPITQASLNTYGVIDTGASGCAIPAAIAQALGYGLTDDHKNSVITGGGSTEAYRFNTTIEVRHPVSLGNNIIFTINNEPIDFIINLPLVLLGTKEFLSNFVLRIDYPRKRFSLTR
jgi:hypothetical protein